MHEVVGADADSEVDMSKWCISEGRDSSDSGEEPLLVEVAVLGTWNSDTKVFTLNPELKKSCATDNPGSSESCISEVD